MPSISPICLVLCFVVVNVWTVPVKTKEEFEPIPFDSFFNIPEDAEFANMEVDGVESAQIQKKTEKMPGQKKTRANDFDKTIGVAPEFTGSFAPEEKEETTTEVSDDDYFGEVSGAVSNPAATYLDGADFEKVSAPKCQMLGCTGPIPNDGSYAALSTAVDNKACHQTFIPMNGCTDDKGYPMGMICSICCDCDNAFVTEMKKTFGYQQNLPTNSFYDTKP